MDLPKKLSFLIFFLLLIVGLLQTKIIYAQTNCDEESDPEFHSLRPYPAEPCDEDVSETALFCGNSLVISDTVSVSQTTPLELDENCTPIGNDRYRCTYKIEDKSRTIAIDLSGAELPIMGNTEDVRNSERSDGFDDAEKINEYVSWYLNGVTGRAETGLDEIDSIISFSGPIKKLLPQTIQHKHQIETIEKALAKDVNRDGESQDKSRHNQIVVCTNLLNKPAACYDSFLGGALNKKYRLDDWDGTLISANIRNILINFWTLFLPDYPQEIIRDSLGDVWEYKTPPLPWQDRFEDNPKKYLKAYKEWRGKTCVLIPYVNLLICHDFPIVSPSNKYANLFPYIPFSSTEDRMGLVELDSFGIQAVSEDITITNVSIKDWSPAELYFAHMQEASDLAGVLQQTFVPKDGSMTGGVTGVSPGGYCDLVNVRTNEGDDLFAGEIGGILSYDAEFSCDFDINETEKVCTKQTSVRLSVLTKTPLADDVWSRTVAGPSAIFKRIFPKVGPGGAILGILDIPAATKVTYTGADFAGNPDNQRSGEGAELYFPHVGGISEYFLTGIQTILRPKGYGKQILSGQAPLSALKALGDICEVADAYQMPCEFLEAIWVIESGMAEGGETCGWEDPSALGPMQIMRSTGGAVTTNKERAPGNPEYLDRCILPDAFEIAARILLWKKYCTIQSCDYHSEDPTGGGSYRLSSDEMEIVGRYHGVNGCAPSAETQCRWGTGYSYCDAARDYIKGIEWPIATSTEQELFCNQ